MWEKIRSWLIGGKVKVKYSASEKVGMCVGLAFMFASLAFLYRSMIAVEGTREECGFLTATVFSALGGMLMVSLARIAALERAVRLLRDAALRDMEKGR